MKVKKEYAVLFFMIAVLIFYIYSEKGQKTHYKLPEMGSLDAGNVSRIVIKKADSETTLLKENDKWLIGDKKYPADDAKVRSMLDKLSNLTLSALVSESKSYGIYELDDRKKIDVRAFRGDEPVRKISIGKPASSYRHTFVMVDDDPRVYHAEGNIRTEFDRSISELRDKTVMKFSDEIAEIELTKGEQNLKIIRETAPVSVETTVKDKEKKEQQEPGKPAWITTDSKAVNGKEVDEIINTLANLQCDEFIEGKEKKDFKDPLYSVTLKGLKTYSISLFGKKDGKYSAVSSESDYPFLIYEWKAKKIMKNPFLLLHQEDK